MQKQDDPSNPPGPLTGQGEDSWSRPSSVGTTMTTTTSKPSPVAALKKVRQPKKVQMCKKMSMVNGPTRDLLSEEVSSTAGQLPPQEGSVARDQQPISIGQAFPGLWETRAVDRETPRRSQAAATSSVGFSGRQIQTIKFDDGEMWPRPSRRSFATIQEMIDNAQHQSTALFNSPPAVSCLNRSGGPRPTPFTSFPNITPIVTNPTQGVPIPFGVQSGLGPAPDPDHKSLSSDDSDADDDEISPLDDRKIADSSDNSHDEEPQPQAEP
jgi:hypothetical protein